MTAGGRNGLGPFRPLVRVRLAKVLGIAAEPAPLSGDTRDPVRVSD
jgi:hypothetical protein